MRHSHENPSLNSDGELAKAEDSQPNASKSKSATKDESGFGRWARRKHNAAVVAQETQDDEKVRPGVVETQLPEIHDGDSISAVGSDDKQQPVLTDADMPDIETLNADSDFSPFFSEGVSKELRNLALKRLFFSGKFSVRDGLDDYDDDFTKFEPLGDTVTSDMKFHARRKEKARLAELEEERLRLESAQAESQTENQAENQAELHDDELSEEKIAVSDDENGAVDVTSVEDSKEPKQDSFADQDGFPGDEMSVKNSEPVESTDLSIADNAEIEANTNNEPHNV